MRQIFLLIAIISMAQLSCNKPVSTFSVPTSPTLLNGKWRMVSVKETASGLTITKPSSIPGDVDIIFTSKNTDGGFLTGNTPTNTISQSDYSTGANQAIKIPALSMTKVQETTWGYEFVNSIRNSQKYGFDTDGKLNITTTAKTLTFKKL